MITNIKQQSKTIYLQFCHATIVFQINLRVAFVIHPLDDGGAFEGRGKNRERQSIKIIKSYSTDHGI
jgi:hypothetical protein